jgi:hypothetical protein
MLVKQVIEVKKIGNEDFMMCLEENDNSSRQWIKHSYSDMIKTKKGILYLALYRERKLPYGKVKDSYYGKDICTY